jgi:hypothetical protein
MERYAQASAPSNQALRPAQIEYDPWAWELLKPADLFSPAARLTPTQERVAMRLWAHADRRTGFTWVTAARIAAEMRVESRNNIEAARAVLVRRGFVERAEEGGRKGWRLLPPNNWLDQNGHHHQEGGPEPKTLSDIVPETLPDSAEDSDSQSQRLCQRESASTKEGLFQLTLPYNDDQCSGMPISPSTPDQLPPAPPSSSEALSAKGEDLRSQNSDAGSSLIARMARSDAGVPLDDARDLVAEFADHLEQLTVGVANLEFERRNGKSIRHPRGYLVDQVKQNRPPLRGSNSSSGDYDERTDDLPLGLRTYPSERGGASPPA